MRNRPFFPALVFCLIVQASLAHSQQLTIQTGTGKQTQLTRTDLEALPHVKITTSAPGSATTFEGASLKAVLEKAGVEFGETMRGKRLASYLLVEAADGYRVVIALPELDPAFTDKQVVLAFLKDGKPLDDKEGPYRIVIPDEKRMARWAKQVTTLKIVDAP
ncbi:MAG TPA: molybdopterin-dependent oxidoreductase [Candidatus Acidoferrum sp.]|nr:molybdopterin-dependent oxidoreductase [Candidatus Acidoferrum sp.]